MQSTTINRETLSRVVSPSKANFGRNNTAVPSAGITQVENETLEILDKISPEDQAVIDNTLSRALPEIMVILGAITNNLDYQETNQFMQQYTQSAQELLEGSMPNAHLRKSADARNQYYVKMVKPSEVLHMFSKIRSLRIVPKMYDGILRYEAVPSQHLSDRIVYQFQIPAGYRGFSPWIMIHELEAFNPTLAELARPQLVMQRERCSLEHPMGVTSFKAPGLRPIPTSYITVVLSKITPKVIWYPGSDPSLHPVKEPHTSWIHCLDRSYGKEHNHTRISKPSIPTPKTVPYKSLGVIGVQINKPAPPPINHTTKVVKEAADYEINSLKASLEELDNVFDNPR